MPIPLHNSIVHNGMIGIISIHIGTLADFSHLFRYFFSNSGSYYIVFSHKSQKSACSASANGKTVVRQTSDRSQEIIRQWSSNRQAIIRQSSNHVVVKSSTFIAQRLRPSIPYLVGR